MILMVLVNAVAGAFGANVKMLETISLLTKLIDYAGNVDIY